MKKLDIKLLENGRLINVLREEVYDNENETLDVFIDYSNTEYNLWEKRCDIVVANGQKSIKLSDTFSLGREYLVQGVLQLQPIAFSGDKVVKFPITSIEISKSLNVLENDTTVTLSIAQEILNDIELFKTGVNGDLVAQNIKIDGLVLDTDTRLSEQDIRLGQQDTAITTNRTDILAEVDRRATIQDDKIDMWDDKITELDESRLTLKNEIVNGDFSQGVNFWETPGNRYVNFEVVDNVARLTWVSGSYGNLIRQGSIFNNTDTFYVSVEAKFNQVRDILVATSGSNVGISQSLGKAKLTWDKYSGLFTGITTVNNSLNLGAITIGVTDLVQEYKNITVINLTETFGAGNEPTKEQMDIIMDTIGYFNGTQTITSKEQFNILLKMVRENALATTSLGGGF